MKTYIISFLLLNLLLWSCKNEPKTAIPPALQNTDLNNVDKTHSANFSNPKNELLYNDYLAIKAALVNTNAAKAEDAAKKLENDFKKEDTYKIASQIATLIASTTNINKQREFFVGLTTETLKILKQDVTDGKIFVQYCPMAFEGKGGYWMSNSNEIRNPYFGGTMLACGEVTEELK